MEKNLSTFNFKRLPGAFLIALSIIVIVYFVEIFILPINFFTFRTWEALMVKGLLPGEFYPNMKISMIETGDLGHHTKFAVEKEVEWETDRYGYRKHDIGTIRHRIVILGDSAVAGTALTQEDMLSEVLERRLKVSVYPFTPSRYPLVDSFLNEKRFIDNPPDVVILERIEKKIPELSVFKLDFEAGHRYSWLERGWKDFLGKHQDLAVLLDRIYKNNMGNYFKSRLEIMIQHPVQLVIKPSQRHDSPSAVRGTADNGMLFLKETVDSMATGIDILPEDIDRIAETIDSYDKAFRKMGINFVFMPVPNKESVYYEELPIEDNKKPRFLKDLVLKLRHRGVEVIDVQQALEEASRKNNILLYHTDDTHWNAEGIKIVADLIEQRLYHMGFDSK